MAALPPPPVAPPMPPNDPNVLLPAAPVSPPTMNNVLEAVKYPGRRDVDLNGPRLACDVPPTIATTLSCMSMALCNQPAPEVPPHHLRKNVYRLTSFAAVAPPWFQAAMQRFRVNLRNDIRADILPDLKRLMNQRRGDGSVAPFEIIPFTNGAQPPNHLSALQPVNAMENLDENQLAAYLTGYGIVPLPAGANPHATNHLRKDI